jgi:TolB-like protein
LIYVFGDCALDTGRRELRRGAGPVPIAPRAFDLLEYLIRNHDRVVSKDDLIAAVWDGRAVSESALTTRINAARCAIGDNGEEQRVIKTLPRKGIRFVAAVREVDVATATIAAESAANALTYPDRPSIAVLPFTNFSGDPEQEYFADGIVEEIITALSRFSSLFVIARNSSFAYKGRTVDVRLVGRELGVRYVLEGSVCREGQRVRITGRLIDASTGVHLWANRFNEELGDIFGVQDNVTASVVGTIAPKVEQVEIEHTKDKPTDNLNAYDCYLRGKVSFHRWTRQANNEALRLFYRATEIDPDYATAYGMAAMCYAQRMMNGWIIDRQQEIAEVARLTGRVAELGKDDAVALSGAAYARGRVLGDFESAIAFVDRALVLNPNLAQAWQCSGHLRSCYGEPGIALEHLKRAVRLSPIDTLMYLMQVATSLAHFLAGCYDEASSWAERALLEKPSFHPALRVAAASHALAGRLGDAAKAMAHLRQLDPVLRISNLKDVIALRRPEDLARYAEGLRMAGLPE